MPARVVTSNNIQGFMSNPLDSRCTDEHFTVDRKILGEGQAPGHISDSRATSKQISLNMR